MVILGILIGIAGGFVTAVLIRRKLKENEYDYLESPWV